MRSNAEIAESFFQYVIGGTDLRRELFQCLDDGVEVRGVCGSHYC